MLGSVKIGAAISKSISGFPVGATVAVTKQSVSSVGSVFAAPYSVGSAISHFSQHVELGYFFVHAAVPQRLIYFRCCPQTVQKHR